MQIKRLKNKILSLVTSKDTIELTNSSNTVDSLATFYEKVERKAVEIDGCIQKIENYAQKFDYTQLHDFIVDRSQTDVELLVTASKTTYSREIISGCFKVHLWLVRMKMHTTTYHVFSLVFLVSLCSSIFLVITSGSLSLPALLVLCYLIFVLKEFTKNWSSNNILLNSLKQQDIKIIVRNSRKINIFELRTLFMQLSMMNLNPKIKIVINQNMTMKLCLSKNKL